MQNICSGLHYLHQLGIGACPALGALDSPDVRRDLEPWTRYL